MENFVESRNNNSPAYQKYVAILRGDEEVIRYHENFDLHRIHLRLDELRLECGINPLYPDLVKIALD